MDNLKISLKQRKETRQITDTLSYLYLALKNIQIYPAGHSLVESKLSIAHQHLTRLLNTKKTVLFGIARNIITYHETPIGENSQACSTLAQILSSHEVSSISFSQGLNKHSLFLFLKTLGAAPEQNQSEKNLQQELSTLKVTHIEVEIINYDYFDRSDNKNSMAGEGVPLTWLSFSQKLTSGILAYSGDTANVDTNTMNVSPETLAAAINKHARRQPGILLEFATLLDKMLKQQPLKNSVQSSFGGQELDQVLVSLNPEIRKQFLNTTLERFDQNIHNNSPEKILETFSDSVVMDMVQQINTKEARVSPALLNLIKKISTIRATSNTATHAAAARQKHISNLLNPESYNKHVDSSYHKSLQNLAKSTATDSHLTNFPLQEHLKTLEEDHLNRQIVQAILLIMEQSDNEQEYSDFATNLIETCLILPETGDYSLLQKVGTSLKNQATTKNNPTIKTTANSCIEQLTTFDFLNYIYSVLPEETDMEKQEAINFLELFCPDILDRLLKIFCMKLDIPKTDPLVAIFLKFRLETLTRIFTNLPKANNINVQKLLTLVGYLGIQGTVRLLQPLLDNKSMEIRVQVLHLLLPTNDNEALATLISMLESENEGNVITAIEICELHKPIACVPSLLKLLEYQFVKQASIERNKKLFPILSHIGDPQALPDLEKIAFTKWLFHREEITAMKRLLFYSLKGYQSKDRSKLVKKGLQIADKEINKICVALHPSHKRTGRKP